MPFYICIRWFFSCNLCFFFVLFFMTCYHSFSSLWSVFYNELCSAHYSSSSTFLTSYTESEISWQREKTAVDLWQTLQTWSKSFLFCFCFWHDSPYLCWHFHNIASQVLPTQTYTLYVTNAILWRRLIVNIN